MTPKILNPAHALLAVKLQYQTRDGLQFLQDKKNFEDNEIAFLIMDIPWGLCRNDANNMEAQFDKALSHEDLRKLAQVAAMKMHRDGQVRSFSTILFSPSTCR